MLTTDRLRLRPWRADDLAPLAAMFADARVMRYFDRPRSAEEAATWMARTRAHIERHGFGIWAVELRNGADFIGFVGLSHVPDTMPLAPGVEIVWTLAEAYWGQGFATEAACAAMADGFARFDLPEIMAFTAAVNLPSQGVMHRLGMRADTARDFDHPRIPPGHRLRRHVVFSSLRPTRPAR
jgi:RimJ/RimL family protein N-acetyltransferase